MFGGGVEEIVGGRDGDDQRKRSIQGPDVDVDGPLHPNQAHKATALLAEQQQPSSNHALQRVYQDSTKQLEGRGF